MSSSSLELRRPPKWPLAKLLRRWQWAYHKKWLRLTQTRYGIAERFGCSWLLDQRSAVDRSLIVRGYWEPEQFARLCELAEENRAGAARTIFLDVGAHIGIFSILMHRKGWFDQVVAFEGEPSTAAQLGANLFLNDLVGRIRLVHAAASDTAGRVAFKAGPDHNRGMGRVHADGQSWAGQVSEVQAVRVGDVVNFAGGFLVAKLDVEGAEMAVLRRMENLLEANDCLLQVECFEGSESELSQWLEPRGFRPAGVVDVDHFFLKSAER